MKKINPIIIIGAPRSGTNILRDTLSTLRDIYTWDCDEIPYIWRYGNKKFITDILTPDMANPKIKSYIRSQFFKIGNNAKTDFILEKTCANSLRVDFVNEILPEAKFIYIIRNGLDVTYSIMQRWESKLSLSYTLKKFNYVPIFDIPYYGFEYIKNRIYKANNNRLKFWGPRFDDSNKILDLTLEEISAKQWVACVNSSNESFKKISPQRLFKLSYEDFVEEPKKIIKEMVEFIGVDLDSNLKFPKVSNSSIGKGSRNLSSIQFDKIEPIIYNTMIENNYN